MIYYIPLEHIDQRYTVHLDRDIENYLNNNNIEYKKITAPKLDGKLPKGLFLDAAGTIKTKAHQMKQISDLYKSGKITDNDKFFFSDLWFPGIESIAYLNYFYKINPKITGIIHAGSFTDTDFVRDMERWAKNFEDIIFDISSKVFVASNFIKNDIIKKRIINPDKLFVSALPLDAYISEFKTNKPKEDIVIFNGRLCDEKQPWLFDRLAEQFKSYSIKFIKTQELNLPKDEYYNLLAKSKAVVSFALQENFGYGIAEAVELGCVPILPNKLVYPELYDKSYLYNTFDDACDMIEDIFINGNDIPPKNKQFNPFKIWFK